MINPQLVDYVRIQRANGLSKDAIIQALAAGGWTQNDVNEAFMAIEGVKTPPPPPPAPAAPAPLSSPISSAPPLQTPASMMNPPRTVVPPPGAQTPAGIIPSMPGAAPMGQPLMRPRVAASEFSTAAVKKRRVWPWVLLLTIFLIVIAGGVIYATFLAPGIIALPNFSR